MTNSALISKRPPANSPDDKPSRAARIAGFEVAVHELRLEGRTFQLDSVPEIGKVIENEMTSDEAVASIIARFREN